MDSRRVARLRRVLVGLTVAASIGCSPRPLGDTDVGADASVGDGSTDASVAFDGGRDAGVVDAGPPCDGGCGRGEGCWPEVDRCESQCFRCSGDADCADGGTCEREESFAGGFCVFAVDAGNCPGAEGGIIRFSVIADYVGCERALGSYECVWSVAVDLDAGTVAPSFRAIEFSSTTPIIDEAYPVRPLPPALALAWAAGGGALDACMTQPTFSAAGELCRTHDLLVEVAYQGFDGGARATSYNVGVGRRPDPRVFAALAATLKDAVMSWPDGGAPPYAP